MAKHPPKRKRSAGFDHFFLFETRPLTPLRSSKTLHPRSVSVSGTWRKAKAKATQWHHGQVLETKYTACPAWWDPSDWLQLCRLEIQDCQLLGEAQFKKPMSGHKSSIEMPHGACKFKSLVLCKMCQDVFLSQCMMNSMAKKPHILSSCAERWGICQSLIYDFQTWFLEPHTGPVDPSFVGCLS